MNPSPVNPSNEGVNRKGAIVTGAATLAALFTPGQPAVAAPATQGLTCCNLINLDLKNAGGEAANRACNAAPHSNSIRLANLQIRSVPCGAAVPDTPAGYELQYSVLDCGIMGRDEENTPHGDASTSDKYKHLNADLYVFIKYLAP